MGRRRMTWAMVVGVLAAVSAAFGCSGQRGGLHPDAEDSQSIGSVPDGSLSEGSPPDLPTPNGPALDGSPPDEMADPGAPQVQHGTKGEARLFLGNLEVGYIFFTVLAPEHPDLAHVFFLPEHRASVGVTDYYVSLVLDRATWRAGAYTGALAGRASITLSTGAEYQSTATGASVTATLTKVGASQGCCLYLDGQLSMVLAAKSGGEPLRVAVNWN